LFLIYKHYIGDDLKFIYKAHECESMTPQYFLSKFIFLDIPLGKIIREMYIKDEEVIIIDPNSHPIRHLTAHRLAHYLFHRNTKVNYFLNERG
jgi:hypothetical protein